MQVRSLSGAPLYRRECHGALWRSALDLVKALAIGTAWAAVCLVLVLALGPPDVVRAEASDGCVSGLPADLEAQLQPLVQALCESSQSITGERDPPSQQQVNFELIAEAMALLALADPGYGYAPPSYGTPGACGSSP